VFSQPYYFRRYQVENGLSNNAVICSVQDSKGFLWFGTKDGLDRFDGYSFKIFRSDPDDTGSLGNNFIHSLFEDPHRNLWVGTERGLYIYNATTESFTLLKGTENGPIRELCMDDKGNLWFIYGFTLSKYHPGKKILKTYDTSKFFEVTSICFSSDKKMWISTPTGSLKKYDAVSDSFAGYDMFERSGPSVSKWIEKIYGTAYGSILVGTSNQGAKIFDIVSSTYKDILTYNQDKTEIFVRNFVETSRYEFWIATESGIFIYNSQTGQTVNLQKTYNDPYSISDNAVYSFCKDREGGIWAGTYFGGVNYHPKQYTPFKKFFPKIGENSLSGNVVREVHQDEDGNLWIGTEDAGLNKLDTGTGVFTHFKPDRSGQSISYTNIHGLLVNGDELWVGTFEHGLDVLNIKTGKLLRHYSVAEGRNSLKSNFIYCISKIDDTDIMIGTTRGAYLFNQKQNDFTLLPGMPLNIWYTTLLKDDKDIIWAGTYGNGIIYYDTRTRLSGNLRYDAVNKNSLGSDRVNSIFEAKNKTLWFATEDGLCRLDRTGNDFTRYTTKNGFPSNLILSILEDDSSNLWISTSKGLVCFDPQTEQLITYTLINGTLSDQFNFSSAYKDNDGRMYFGSVKGLISFHPDEFSKNKFIPPVYITGFQVFNQDLTIGKNGSPLTKSLTYTDKITLDHDQSTLSISFAALSYTDPEMSAYAYKMEGLDDNWTYLKTNRKAYFTELVPGEYTFKVKASNSSGVWNEQETSLVIEILPPWWASPFAYGTYLVVGLLLISYLIRNYHNRIEAKNRRKIELLEIAKEKEIFQAKIEFFTNVAHEIRTPLTLIKGPLEKVMKRADLIPDLNNNLKIMEKNTNRLIDLSNQLLDFRQTEIKGFSLSFVKTNVSELLEETYLNFKTLADQKNLSYNIDSFSSPLFAYVDAEALNKILCNLFSNAVKYANGKVLVELLPFSEEHKTFTILIKNDGYLIPYEKREQIFQPFFRLKETEKQKGTGIGLALARSLAELHKGILYLREPEKDLNVFQLSLPIHQENEFNLYEEQSKNGTVVEVNRL
jgi:ligand-binding sensor domain-containing protein/signal transduction histidine kinase